MNHLNKISLLTLSAVTFLILFAGIMRDDVPITQYLQLGKQKQFKCVGQVFKEGKPSGSFVLVGKHYVLSATHVFMDYTFKTDTVNMGGGAKAILNRATPTGLADVSKYTFNIGGKIYTGRKLITYGDKQLKNQPDIVLIELDADVQNVQPAYINTAFDELGADVTGVGFGVPGYSKKTEKINLPDNKLGGENVVDSIGGQIINGQGSSLICDFDSPFDKSLNRIGNAEPRPLEYICSGGDSGGGMFRENNRGWELVGICHGADAGIDSMMKNGYYGLLMNFTRVSVFSSWIKANANN